MPGLRKREPSQRGICQSPTIPNRGRASWSLTHDSQLQTASVEFICLLLWLSLSTPAKIAGTMWMAAGIAFGAWRTRGFRGDLVNFDLPPDDA